MDENMILGKWWLPERPQRRVFGLLQTPRDEAITLSLAGDLIGTSPSETILGRTQGGVPVTLRRCFATSRKGRWIPESDDASEQDILVHVALFGDRLKEGDEGRFRFVEVNYSSLPEFAGMPTFRPVTPASETELRTIGVEQTKETKFQYNDTEILFVVGTREKWAGNTATLQSDCRFYFFSKTPRTLDEWQHQFLGPMGYLLTLALGRASVVTHQSMLKRAPWWTYAKAHKRVPEITVRRGRPLSGRDGAAVDRPLFRLSDEGIDLESIVTRWLDAAPLLELPFNLYFATVFAPFMYLETRFLNLVQAAEGYHRVRFPQAVEDPETHDARLKAIYAAIENEEHKAWLEGQIGEWSNEPRLRHRLADLVKLARSQGITISAKDRKSFINSVLMARNDLSQGGLGPDKTAKSAFVKLNRRLRIILHACFVKELGLPSEVAARVLRSSAQLR